MMWQTQTTIEYVIPPFRWLGVNGDLNGGRRGATPRATFAYFGTSCPKVDKTKCARVP